MSEEKFRFSVATESQIDEIYKISSMYDLNNKLKLDRGFLVSSFTKKQYLDFFNDKNKYLFVSTLDNKVVGFILGYYAIHGTPSVSLDTILKVGTKSDFIVKQICVHPDSPKGTGSYLMNTLFQLFDSDIYLAIVSDPLNVSSLLFHRKMGFVNVTEIKEKDGMNRFIMVRYKKQGLDSFADIGLAQYQSAVDLYKHEDQLTWTKFNFSIITNGAILSFLIPNISDGFNSNLFTFLMIVVIVINIGYIYTIHMGRIYLQKRKQDAINMEEKLQHLGMGYLIKSNGHNIKRNKLLEHSRTKIVQYTIPIIFILGWLVALVLSLTNNL